MAAKDTLHEALEKKIGVGVSQVNKRIVRRENERLLTRRLAMLSLASDAGINLRRYATEDELAALRGIDRTIKTTPPLPPLQPVVAPSQLARALPRGSGQRARAVGRARKTPVHPDSVMVVYGRDKVNRDALFRLLRALKLDPIEWDTALAETGLAQPSIRDAIDAAFRIAKAVVVLMTSDDLVVLRPGLQKRSDPEYEKRQTGQARPNVLFEAGMAFGLHRDETVIVSVGAVKPLSDMSGLHVTRLDNGPESRLQFANKLRNAGCSVETDGRTDWMTEGQFEIREDEDGIR